MKKFIKNLIKLILINTPYFILKNFIENFFKNYFERKKSKNLESIYYKNFYTIDQNSKWFCNNLQFLTKNIPKIKGSSKINDILEIGSYEGRSAIFFLSFFHSSKIACVDTWKGSDEHKKNMFKDVELNFDRNTLSYVNKYKLKKIKEDSDSFFEKNCKFYDLIYLDGDHNACQVSKDLDNAWNCLQNGGILILDDYLWWYYKKLKKNPSKPINNFLLKNKNKISKLIVWNQVLIKKNF